MKGEKGHVCPINATLEAIGGKWKAKIIWYLIEDKKRFGELKRCIPEATEKMLIQQLRELEDDKIVKRKVFRQVPPKVEYALTDFGRSLVPVLDAMGEWGLAFVGKKNQ